jgi:hypothetical protein
VFGSPRDACVELLVPDVTMVEMGPFWRQLGLMKSSEWAPNLIGLLSS